MQLKIFLPYCKNKSNEELFKILKNVVPNKFKTEFVKLDRSTSIKMKNSLPIVSIGDTRYSGLDAIRRALSNTTSNVKPGLSLTMSGKHPTYLSRASVVTEDLNDENQLTETEAKSKMNKLIDSRKLNTQEQREETGEAAAANVEAGDAHALLMQMIENSQQTVV